MADRTAPATSAPRVGPAPGSVRSDASVPGGAAGRETGARFASVVEDIDAGRSVFPLPGSGRTAERLSALRAAAEDDLCVARLVEGHVDALAILAELGGPRPRAGQRWAVWAAQPPGTTLEAVRSGDGWALTGRKPYCSGAHACTHALVTAPAPDGPRLFAVAVDPLVCVPVEGTWQAVGMAGSDSPDVSFEHAPATAVGGVDAYVRRPGFQHGGIGVAACWYGGALAVARPLREAAARRSAPHADAHLGAADVQLHAAGAVLDRAAAEIDDDPSDKAGGARVRSLRVRALVESVCSDVLTRVGRATGAGPLCHDPRHARAAADLAVYLRQHHAERDLAGLGALLARPQDTR